jgi:hypothetical protein
VVQDEDGNRLGEKDEGIFVDEAKGIYIRKQQLIDGHYATDVFASEGSYLLDMKGTSFGEVKIVTGVYNEKSGQYTVKKGEYFISEDEGLSITVSGQLIGSAKVEFEDVKSVVEIGEIPDHYPIETITDLDLWIDENWSEYVDRQCQMNASFLNGQCKCDGGYVQDENGLCLPSTNKNFLLYLFGGCSCVLLLLALVIGVILVLMKKKKAAIIVFILVLVLLVFSALVGGVLYLVI